MQELGRSSSVLPTYLAFVGHAGVEPVVQTVALEVDVFGHPLVEGVLGQVVPVELFGQVRVPDVVQLGVPRQGGLGHVGGVGARFCCSLQGINRNSSEGRAGYWNVACQTDFNKRRNGIVESTRCRPKRNSFVIIHINNDSNTGDNEFVANFISRKS
jgi:hypothetical protein